jgi:hypothetical protein
MNETKLLVFDPSAERDQTVASGECDQERHLSQRKESGAVGNHV